MKKLLAFSAGFLMCSSSLYSQSQPHVFKDWSGVAGSQAFYQKNRTVTDGSGNIYLAGATVNGSGNYDILVAKYNSSGVQQWIVQYDGTGAGQDMATGLVVDASGNVYITGVTTTTTNVDMVTIKYNSSGAQQWLSTYNGTGSLYDCGSDLALDGSGNVFACGSSYNASGNLDYVTIKYNSSGVQQWATLYAHSGGMDDVPVRVGYRALTGVTVSGAVQTGSGAYSFGVVKYNATTGAQTAATISSGGSSGIDRVFDMCIDASDNIYIAGGLPLTGQGYNTCVIKLNSSLAIQWQATYNGADSLDDMANGVDVDASGNVYIAGYTTSSTQGKDFLTIKYNSSGTQQWANIHNGTASGDDAGNAIVLDASANVYVTGYDSTATNGTDYYTMKYNSSGTLIWSVREDGDAHRTDKATNISLSGANNNVAVTGASMKADGTYEYKALKYIQKDIITPTDFDSETPQSTYSFYENKGQLLNTNDTLVPSVRYYVTSTMPKHYVMNNSCSYVFARVDTSLSTSDTLHRIDLTFNQVNANAKTYAMEEQEDYINYHFSHLPEGVTKVHANRRLVTPDLYTNIDLEYFSNQNGIKYYFIVKPGASPSSIKLEFAGASSFNLDGTTNALTITSSIGSITFDRPTVYQLTSSNVIVPIVGWTADWQTNGAANKYKFNIGAYDNTKPLIIQVDQGNAASTATAAYKNLTWSTYYGGNDDEKFTDMVSDNAGDIYTCGETTSSDFPVTTGTSNPSGHNMAVLVKFTRQGVLKYATYYGVTITSQVPLFRTKLDVDSYGNAFMAGTVARTSGVSTNIPFPGTPPVGAYVDNTYGGGTTGGTEMFLTKFDSFGILKWATYYGSAGYDDVADVNVDLSDDIYLTYKGFADSLKQKPGAYWNNVNSGSVIVKFNSSLQRTWATAFGGGIQRGAFDKVGNFFITGGINTGATGMPWTNAGGTADFDTTLNGGNDVYIARFSKSGSVLQWLSSFGGSGADNPYSIAIDKNDNIYLTGTTGSTDFPYKLAGAGTYCDSVIGGTLDAFLFKYGSAYDRKWGSFFGGASATEVGYDVATDPITAQVFFTGYTNDNTITFWGSTPYYSQSYGGGTAKVDGYILAYTSGIVPVWGTYLGYNWDDPAVAITTNDWNQLFLAGYTRSNQTGNFLNINPGGGAWFVNSLYSGGTGLYDGHISRFTIDPANTIGINENTFAPSGDLSVYPNPSNGQFSYTVNSNEKTVFVKVYNMVGQMIFMEKVEPAGGMYKGVIDLTDANNGVYFVVAETISGRMVKRVIKQ